MGKKKIVIDTNNYISALGWQGKSRELFNKVIDGEYEVYMSIKQLEEFRRVMDYPRLKFTNEQKSKFLEILFQCVNVIGVKTELNVVEDPKDNMLVECAVESGAGWIISGDGHLKKIGQYRNIKMVTVNQFLNSNK